MKIADHICWETVRRRGDGARLGVLVTDTRTGETHRCTRDLLDISPP
jgi:hypothetical protein